MARALRIVGVVGQTRTELDLSGELPIFILAEFRWKAETKEGDSPVGERIEDSWSVPEYHGTRGIPWEAGGTTLQG